MKKLKVLSGIILIITAFLFGGCYTQLAMNNNGGSDNGSYGYDNGQDYQNEQTPADSTYGDQYGDNGDYQDQLPGSIYDYNYGYPPFTRYPFWRYGNSISIGFGWGSSFYDPYYWDPFGLWTNYYPNYWGPYPYYPVYYDPYYSPYWGGNWSYNNGQNYVRSHEMTRLRNDNGLRDRGDRNGYRGSYGTGILNTPSSTRNEPLSATGSRGRTQSPAVNNRNNNDRNQNRPNVRSERNSRNENGRAQRSYSRPNNNTRNSEGRSSYSQPRRSSNGSSHSYAPRSYSPPARSYSPPARSYSAPRSYSPPPARSSGDSRSGSDRNRSR